MKRDHCRAIFIGVVAFGIAVQGVSSHAQDEADPLVLVSEGEAKAMIVLAVDASPAAREGAAILSDHIYQISGARLRTLQIDEDGKGTLDDGSEPGGEGMADTERYIIVGKSNYTETMGASTDGLGPGGIVIQTFPKTSPNVLVLLGEDDPASTDPRGTRYAVTTFLEQELGVRFLWPGEMGKVVPKRKTIAIEAIDYRFSPMIVQRKIRMGGSYSDRMSVGGGKLGVTEEDFKRLNQAAKQTESADAGWAGWHRLGGSLRLTSGHSYGHAWEKYGEEHPDWFAMAPNGSRDQSASPHRARLCVSNQGLVEALAQEAIDKINETGQKSVAIGPNDGGKTSFCTCPECEALDAPTERRIQLIDFSPGANRRPFEHVPLTDRYVKFWNGIAERVTAVHPDVWLTADAYSAYSAPPVEAKLHPNIAIRYVGVSYLKESRRQQGLEDWDAWAEAASKIYFRSNLLLAGRRQGTPAIYPHKLAEDFRRIAHNKMIGTDFDSCMHHWATQGLNYYVLAKLLWDPDQDIDAILDDYFESGFGAGAEAVKRYFARLEELTNDVAAADGELGVTAPYTPEVIGELRALLDDASAAAKGDAESSQRIGFLRSGLDYTDAYAAIFRINREWQDGGGGRLSAEMKERAHQALNRNWEMSRDIFENHHLAINVASVAWGSWGYFGRFQWKPPVVE